MTRWELINANEYVEETIECIIRSRRSVIEMRKEASEFMLKLKRELLHGNQGNGCFDRNCKICYPYRRPKKKKP